MNRCAAPLRRWGGSGLALTLLLAPLGAGRESAQAKAAKAVDANALVRRMVALYQGARTLQGSSEAKLLDLRGKTIYQTNSFKFRKPNRIVIASQDPQLGSLSLHANGRTVTIYSGRQNIFTKRTSPASLPGVMNTIQKTTTALTGAQIMQTLNPLSFLLAKTMPREAQSFRYNSTQMVEGRKTHVVTANASDEWMRLANGRKGFVPLRRDIILYIDAATNQLVKSRVRFIWQATAAPKDKKGKAQRVVDGYGFEEKHRETILNQSIPDAEFNFAPPKDAKEIYQERK